MEQGRGGWKRNALEEVFVYGIVDPIGYVEFIQEEGWKGNALEEVFMYVDPIGEVSCDSWRFEAR